MIGVRVSVFVAAKTGRVAVSPKSARPRTRRTRARRMRISRGFEETFDEGVEGFARDRAFDRLAVEEEGRCPAHAGGHAGGGVVLDLVDARVEIHAGGEDLHVEPGRFCGAVE